ncbi:uncharacterized protein LOC143299754 [Babylonia areolata]|uniref:uncharacterized protein LOC143299754 n=1 Tax=Babylonia areolata TaxID=304850 RepID=UPI003FCF2407
MERTGIGVVWLCLGCVLVSVQADDVNVAPGKTYRQSSKYFSSDDSGKAANGNTDGDYPSNGIHTVNNNDEWWEVDLGGVYRLQDMTAWARPGFNRRLVPFAITVDGQECASIQSMPDNTRRVDVACSAVMYGQTVRITRQPPSSQISDDRSLNMAEMQIWVPSEVSDCPVGRYGPSCNSNCSLYCQNGPGKNACSKDTGNCYDYCQAGWYRRNCTRQCGRCLNTQTQNYCHSTNGQCRSGCQAGWHTPLCNEECPDGFYGEGCEKTCGNCRNTSECRHDTGQCTGGCTEGFTGSHCTEDKTSDAIIIGSSVGAGLILIGICIFLCVRKRCSSRGPVRNVRHLKTMPKK